MRTRPTRPTVVLFVSLFAVSALSAQTVSEALRACAEARNREIREANAERQKKQTDASARLEIEIRNCAGDSACRTAAVERNREERRQIANEHTAATAEIEKRYIDCQTDARSGNRSGPPTAGPDADGMYALSAQLDEIRRNPLQNVLAAADQFFKGLLDWGIGTLNFLAQKRGGFGEFGAPTQQIIDYLVNHPPTSFQQQYDKAQKAAGEFQQNPARFLGREIPNLIPGSTAKAAEGASAATRAGRGITALNAEAKRFTPLANQLTKATTNPRRPPVVVEPPPLTGSGPITPPAGSPYRGPPPEFGNRPPGQRTGIPATCYENQCWRNAQAVDEYWKTGNWQEPPVRGYPLAEELHDLPTPGAVLIQDLRRGYGGRNALDPMHGPLGQKAHAHGIPVASSKNQIEDVMRQKGPGAQGFAMIQWEQDVAGIRLGGGHIVNVRTLENNVVEFFDRSTQNIANLRGMVEPAMWQNAREVYFFLTKDGRTP